MSERTLQGTTGMGHAPGWFLADSENCTRVTQQISAEYPNVKTMPNGGKYVPTGSLVNGGVAYEDVDVTYGDAPGSVVTSGAVYLDRLNLGDMMSAEEAAEALAEAGFTVISAAPTVTRPDWDEEEGGGDEGGGEAAGPVGDLDGPRE